LDSLHILIFNVAYYLTLLACAAAFIRFLLGPSVADRVVALDVMTISGISLIVFLAMFGMRVIYLDVAMLYALLSFLGVLAFARYLEGGL